MAFVDGEKQKEELFDAYNVKSLYRRIDYPYLSKTSYISAVMGCPYRFKQLYIDGVKTQPNLEMQTGSYLHYIYDVFFDLIDYDHLWMLHWMENHDTSMNSVYNYFLSLCYTRLPEKVNSFHVLTCVKSFCRMEENHWWLLRSRFTNKDEVIAYFAPVDREKFYSNPNLQIYGSRDRTIRETEKILIVDYKTGKAPKHSEDRDNQGIYNPSMPDYKVVEGNFYCLLWLLENGYTFDFTEYSKNGEPKWECYKSGKVVKLNFLDYAFIYTNYQRAIITRKQASLVSIRNILNQSDQWRSLMGKNKRKNSLMRIMLRVCIEE